MINNLKQRISAGLFGLLLWQFDTRRICNYGFARLSSANNGRESRRAGRSER